MRALLALIVILVTASCVTNGSSESVIETRVSERLQATVEVAEAIQTGIAESQAATAAIAATTIATIAPNVVAEPTMTATPTQTPEPTPTPVTVVIPTMQATPVQLTPPPVPLQESPADQLAREGFYPFDRPELAIMIHPRLSLDDRDNEVPPATVEYIFTDFQAEYIFFELSVYMDYGAKRSISDEEIRALINGTVLNSDHISSHEIIATDPTSVADHPGRIGRFNFVTDGHNAYGVVMVFSYGEWLYRFDVYGRDYEYAFIEELVSSVYQSAFLRGDGDTAIVNIQTSRLDV